jgi:TRAP-type C4-dicarboxylate transport system permease small subunit
MSGAKLDKLLVTGAEVFCALLLLLIAGLTIAKVIMLYVFNYPLRGQKSFPLRHSSI